MCALITTYISTFLCVVLLVALTYPVPLEAVLTAKVRLFTQLLAIWTLQCACIVLAVRALAFPLLLDRHLFGRCLVHVVFDLFSTANANA